MVESEDERKFIETHDFRIKRMNFSLSTVLMEHVKNFIHDCATKLEKPKHSQNEDQGRCCFFLYCPPIGWKDALLIFVVCFTAFGCCPRRRLKGDAIVCFAKKKSCRFLTTATMGKGVESNTAIFGGGCIKYVCIWLARSVYFSYRHIQSVIHVV